jgi:hypothetical protein
MRSFLAFLLLGSICSAQAVPGVLSGGTQPLSPPSSPAGTYGQLMSLNPATNQLYFSNPETIGIKLRKKALTAVDPFTLPIMNAIEPWQPSTAYYQYDAVINGGGWYVCITAGTSASSGGPTGTGTGPIADNSINWGYVGLNPCPNAQNLTITPWAANTAYTKSLTSLVSNGGKVYACVANGTSAGSGGPSGTSNAITDNSVTWSYYGPVAQLPPLADYCSYVASASSSYSIVWNPNTAYGVGITAALPIAKGSSYAVNDTITLTGGTFSQAVVLTVTSVSSGGVTGVSITNAGTYTAYPGVTAAQGSTSGSGTGATFNLKWPDPPFCRLRGCYNNGSNGSSQIVTAVFAPALNCAPVNVASAMEFYSDAPRLEFVSAGHFTCYVDGVRAISNSKNSTGNSTAYYHQFDFTAGTGLGRKTRLWRFEFNGFGMTGYVKTDATSQLWQPSDTERVRVAFITDSYGAGSSYHPYIPGNSYGIHLGKALGWNDVYNLSTGGTGYVAQGAGPGTTTNQFGFRVTEALTLNPDVWVVAGSVNDNAQTTGTITSAAASMLTAIRAGSNAPIFVVGVPSINDGAYTTSCLNMENAVFSGWTATNDPLVFTVPFRGALPVPWWTNSWNNTNLNTSANSTVYIGGDNVHPNDAGMLNLVNRAANGIRSKLLSAP